MRSRIVLCLALCAVPAGLLGCRRAAEPPSGPAEPSQTAIVQEVAVAEEAGPVLVFSGRAMGVKVQLQVAGGAWGLLSPAQHAALVELSRLEDIVNPWDGGSELSRWNDGPPEGGRVSPELAELVGLALELCAETDGAFDPTVGALLASRGHYGEPIPLDGDPAELIGCDRVRLVAGPNGMRLERLHPGVRLDLSGLAKGWAADRVKAQLVAAGVTNACLDLGSSTVVAWGPGPDGRGWGFRSASRAQPDGELWLVDQAVATSGSTPRAVDPAQLTGVHLVEPSEARFVESRPRVAVARGSNAAACDAWATAVLVSDVWPAPDSGVSAEVHEHLRRVELEFPSKPDAPQTTR
jgi:FAD:protein FMN transferase